MATNLDRGLNDLEEVIDKLKKQKEILQNRLKKLDRTEEIMALYAEVKRLKNLNEDLQRELHDRKTND
jgi:chaperonin cofactor prefoldin